MVTDNLAAETALRLLRRVLTEADIVVNDDGYLVALSDDTEMGTTIIDLSPDELAFVKLVMT